MSKTIPYQTFLDKLAEGAPEGVHLLVAEAYTAPGSDHPVFPAKAWTGQALSVARAWYYCVGGSTQPKRRQRGDISHVRALVLDDVGTKVPVDSIKLPPSYKMETSKGNFQYGYLLAWSTKLADFDALNDTLAASGLQDSGAKGRNRLVRTPGSVNQKPGRASFVSTVREWHPGRVWATPKALAKALGVKPGAARRAPKVLENAGTKGLPDPVFDWLNAQGMVHAVKSEGWYEVTCPLAHEHGADPRTDAAYKPLGADDRGTRGVKCFHSHGEAPGFSQRFLDAIAAQGGPRVSVDGMAERSAEQGKQLAALLAKAMPQAAVAPYDHISLYMALGPVPKSALVNLDQGTKGPHKLQPTSYVNVLAVLATLGVRLRYNLMTHQIDYVLPARIDPARMTHQIKGGDVRRLLDAIYDVCVETGMRSKRDYRNAIDTIAMEQVYHPMQDWITSAPWDGRDHFAMLLSSVETPSPNVFKAFLWRWLVQGVEAVCGFARVPLAQKSGVLVLVGKQGIGKTRWLTSLAPGFSMEGAQLHLSGFGARDTMHEALSHAIVELGELEITFGKSESGALKNFLSRTGDMYRLPYAEHWIERPRCTSFCGSVNDPGFLVDSSGSRRFWPVDVARCFADHGVDTQQLWAQAHAAWLKGAKWWLTDEEDALREHRSERFAQPDAVSERLHDEIKKRESDPEKYSISCGLNITAIHTLVNLPLDRRSLSTGTAAMRKLVANPRDLRLFNGSSRAWIVGVSTPEMAAHKLVVLKPGADKAT